MSIIFKPQTKALEVGCMFSKKSAINNKGFIHPRDVLIMSDNDFKLFNNDEFTTVSYSAIAQGDYSSTNEDASQTNVFQILDATGETVGRKAVITESDCDVHIDVEHYRINLQNYSGDFEITIVDKLIDANVANEEVHNIPLRCKT